MLFGGASYDPAKLEKLEQAFEFLNGFLEGETWAAGSTLTIADLALVSSVSTCDAVGFPIAKYPNVQKWYTKAQKEIPDYSVNAEGTEIFKQLFLQLTANK